MRNTNFSKLGHLRQRLVSTTAALVVLASSLAAAVPLLLTEAVSAAPSTVVVTPANTQGWSTADTRPGGAVNFITDATSPAPDGALQLTTDATTTSKAQYLHAASTPLSNVNELSYYTKQNAPSGPVADPSYQLPVCLTGVTGANCSPGLTGTTGTSSFATLVFEPYQNPGNNGNATVVNGVWQKWDVANGKFWSTRTVVCSGGTIVGTSGGPATYTLSQIKTICPSAVVVGYGVNIGTNNPSYNVETDLFDFNGTTYNFEVTNTPDRVSQCKNGGYKNFTDSKGNAFKNQGDCVSFVRSNAGGNHNKVTNNNNVNVTNNNSQSARSGNANSSGNTNGGSATSGNASNNNSSNYSFTISNNPTF